MTTYYRVDGAKLSYAEYWRLSPGAIPFAIAAGLKLIGFPLRFKFAIPRPDRLFLVEFEELPSIARRALEPELDSAESAGFRLLFCHRLALPEPDRLGAACVLLDEKNLCGLMVMFGKHGDQRELHLVCVSCLVDDRLAVTTTMKQSLNSTPWQSVERYPGANVRVLDAMHREHLARLDNQGAIPIRLDPDRLDQFIFECELRYVDYHIERGVFVPMTEEELDAISGTANDSW